MVDDLFTEKEFYQIKREFHHKIDAMDAGCNFLGFGVIISIGIAIFVPVSLLFGVACFIGYNALYKRRWKYKIYSDELFRIKLEY